MFYALWYGGSSYVIGDDDDVELFDTLEDAYVAYSDRRDRGYMHRQAFRYADGRTSCVFTPCVDDSEMWLFESDPRGREFVPDARIVTAPDGMSLIEA